MRQTFTESQWKEAGLSEAVRIGTTTKMRIPDPESPSGEWIWMTVRAFMGEGRLLVSLENQSLFGGGPYGAFLVAIDPGLDRQYTFERHATAEEAKTWARDNPRAHLKYVFSLHDVFRPVIEVTDSEFRISIGEMAPEHGKPYDEDYQARIRKGFADACKMITSAAVPLTKPPED